MNVTSPYDLTPIEQHKGILFKRDDLFTPYEINSVNGGKLRQCIFLLKEYGTNKHIYTYSNLDSPQSPITATVCKNLQLPCTIYYGGTNNNSAMKHHMVRLSKFYNAKINYDCKTGRHSVLNHTIQKILTSNDFLVEYGINLKNYKNSLLKSTTEQVKNIPNELNNLIITCGSGITASGILIGIKKYQKQIKNIILISTAPDRKQRINNILTQYNIQINFSIIDLYHMSNFNYEKKQPYTFDNIILHPNYQAKTFKVFLNSDINKEKSLFWIIGAYPELDIKY